MNASLWALIVIFGWGIVHFITAIPAGVGMGLHPAAAAVAAWAGYTTIGAVMLLIGAPARNWVIRKFKFSAQPDPKKLIWRVWQRWGLPGLGLLAPGTIGPYFAVLLALTLGEKSSRVIWWIALGAIPWAIVIAALVGFGVMAFEK